MTLGLTLRSQPPLSRQASHLVEVASATTRTLASHPEILATVSNGAAGQTSSTATWNWTCVSRAAPFNSRQAGTHFLVWFDFEIALFSVLLWWGQHKASQWFNPMMLENHLREAVTDSINHWTRSATCFSLELKKKTCSKKQKSIQKL